MEELIQCGPNVRIRPHVRLFYYRITQQDGNDRQPFIQLPDHRADFHITLVDLCRYPASEVGQVLVIRQCIQFLPIAIQPKVPAGKRKMRHGDTHVIIAQKVDALDSVIADIQPVKVISARVAYHALGLSIDGRRR